MSLAHAQSPSRRTPTPEPPPTTRCNRLCGNRSSGGNGDGGVCQLYFASLSAWHPRATRAWMSPWITGALRRIYIYIYLCVFVVVVLVCVFGGQLTWHISTWRMCVKIVYVCSFFCVSAVWQDYGTLSCWGQNEVGLQKQPCVYQIVLAGE